jgi:uncharacterized protein (DUF169 family)
MLTPEKIACPAAKTALDLGPTGRKNFLWRNASHDWTFRKQRGSCQNYEAYPTNKRRLNKSRCSWTLRYFAGEPDLVIIESTLENIMWLGLAINFETGRSKYEPRLLWMSPSYGHTARTYVNR